MGDERYVQLMVTINVSEEQAMYIGVSPEGV